MADYINRGKFAMHLADIQYGEAPTGRTGENIDYQNGVYAGFDMAYVALKRFPAADVRPVVTCGKCKYGKYTGTSWLCDKHSGHADKFGEDSSYSEYHSKHWFCADGEERNHA